MRTALIILLLILHNIALAGKPEDLLEVRKFYYLATESEKHLGEFDALLIKFQNPDNTILGYIGMSFMLRAKYAWLPNNKLSYFNQGKKYLESAIAKDPKNLELIFMRFCVQSNAPGFLFYSSNINSDKQFILKAFNSNLDEDLKLRIVNYMKEEKTELSPEEMNLLNLQ